MIDFGAVKGEAAAGETDWMAPTGAIAPDLVPLPVGRFPVVLLPCGTFLVVPLPCGTFPVVPLPVVF